MRQLFFRGQSFFFFPAVTVVFRGVCLACLEDFSVVYIYIYIYIFFHDRINTYFLKPFSPNKFLSEKQVTGRDVNFFTLYGGQFTF